jgi:hypothetical protein
MDKSTNNKSRRKFLDNSIVVGTGLVSIGLASAKLIEMTEESKVVKMITLDGKLMEVDKKYINPICGGKASNATLKKWMDKEKNKVKKS